MEELSLDAAVANRFISSLSKSLQALCHGCMDFDNGIEIVGFINVNIDRGNKVDYVLNEKVEKSANNSMTFVSNSFLAKKDQPKVTRDGSCSPVQELNMFSTSQQNYSYQHSQEIPHGRRYPYSALPQAHPGSHKRPWNGDDRYFRGSPRKQFRGRRPAGHQPQAFDANSNSPAFASPTAASTPLIQHQNSYQVPEASLSSSDNVNVKKETFKSEKDQCFNESAVSDNTDSTNVGSNLNIKPDPEPISFHDQGISEGACNKSDNFLDEPSSNSKTDQQTNEFPGLNETPDIGTNSNLESEKNSELASFSTNPPSSEYDDPGKSTNFPQPSFSGQEEESSRDASGFDVIEIDDEDEDMQAMFGDNQQGMKQTANVGLMHSYHVENLETPTGDYFFQGKYQCKICFKEYRRKQHLSRHMKVHAGRRFTCPICDNKFTQIYSLKTHLRNVHCLTQCAACLETFAITETNSHRCPNIGFNLKTSTT